MALGSVAGAMIVAVGYVGGAPLGASILALVLAGIALASASVASPRRVNVPWFGLWLVALGALALAESIELPRGIVAALAPLSVANADLAAAALGLEPLDRLTLALAPGDAAHQAARYFAGASAAFGVTAALAGRRAGRLAGGVPLLVLAVALGLGVLSFAAVGRGPVLGMYTPLDPGARKAVDVLTGTFVNPNHTASYLNLTLPVCLALAAMAEALPLRVAAVGASVWVGVSVLLTASRGGALVLVFSALCTLLVLWNAKPTNVVHGEEDKEIRLRRLRNVAFVVLTLLTVGALIALPRVLVEFDGMSARGLRAEEKLRVYPLVIGMLPELALVGVGPGGLPVVAAARDGANALRPTHVENVLLQVLVDHGLVLGGLLLAGLGATLARMLYRGRRDLLALGAALGVVAVFIENLVDFSLELPGVLVPAAMLAALAEMRPRTAVTGDQDLRNGPSSRLFASVALIVVVLGGLAAYRATGRTWEDIDEVGTLPVAEAETVTLEAYAGSNHAFYLLARRAIDAGDTARAVRLFEAALRLRPASLDTREALARTLTLTGRRDEARAHFALLLGAPLVYWTRVVNWLVQHGEGEGLLLEAFPDDDARAHEIARSLFYGSRPDLVERIALRWKATHVETSGPLESLRASAYVARGELHAASAIAARLLAEPTTARYGWVVEGAIRSAAGRHVEAYHLLLEGCQSDRLWWEACSGAIRSAIAAGRFEEARRVTMESIATFRANPSAQAQLRIFLSQISLATGHKDDALREAQGALAYAPDMPEALRAVADAHIALGNRERARYYLNRVIEIVPTDAGSRRLYEQMGER